MRGTSQCVLSSSRRRRFVAKRIHRGEVVAHGNWEPILDTDTWRSVDKKLRRVANSALPGRQRHLLTELVVCGVCGRADLVHVVVPEGLLERADHVITVLVEDLPRVEGIAEHDQILAPARAGMCGRGCGGEDL